MIDLLTFVIALVIITTIVGFFGYLAWKMTISDPLARDENTPVVDSSHEKRKKEKNTTEQGKKKRKEQKKSKRDVKDEDQVQQQHQQTQRNKPSQTSEETDDEREESEQDASAVPVQSVETSSKARKRNKNKTRSTTPPSSSTISTEEKTKTSVATRAPPATHLKSTSKDELESTKQQPKVQVQSAPNKKTTQPVQKQQQQQEQPFIVVGGNRHKIATPPIQQNKSQVNTTSSVAPVQQSSITELPNEPLAQRPPVPQKEIPTSHSASTANPLPMKQQSQVPAKIADLIKVLPSSQAVVTELMSALDAFPLSADELDIIMHKIANKQSVIKQDWSKLQHGQKVDPQAHIGQVLDESAKAYEDDMKTNSMKRIKDLTDELNHEKRRNNELVKEQVDHQREIQILHAQLDSVQTKPETSISSQQKLQTLELQLKRITDENMHLNQQLAAASSSLSGGDASHMQVQVLSEQIKKLSVDNANLEKKVHSNELLVRQGQKENEQLNQSVQKAEKTWKEMEDKWNENRTLHFNEINDYKLRIQQLENDNEQLKREEIVHVEPTITTDIQTITLKDEEREQLEKDIEQLKENIQSKEREYQDWKDKLTKEMEDYKKRIENLQAERQKQENEIDRLKQEKTNEQRQFDESCNQERAELSEMKSKVSQSEERLRREHEKQRLILADLLSDDLRNQLPNDNQDFDQWLSSYQQLFASNKRTLQEQSTVLKHENDQLLRNMAEIENQLKEIEKTVQNKEENLLNELRHKETDLDHFRSENEHLNTELQRLRQEIQHLQSIHHASISEARILKAQLDDKFLAATQTPSIITADESFELVKQPSPSLSPIVIDIRAEQTTESTVSSSTSDQQS